MAIPVFTSSSAFFRALGIPANEAFALTDPMNTVVGGDAMLSEGESGYVDLELMSFSRMRESPATEFLDRLLDPFARIVRAAPANLVEELKREAMENPFALAPFATMPPAQAAIVAGMAIAAGALDDIDDVEEGFSLPSTDGTLRQTTGGQVKGSATQSGRTSAATTLPDPKSVLDQLYMEMGELDRRARGVVRVVLTITMEEYTSDTFGDMLRDLRSQVDEVSSALREYRQKVIAFEEANGAAGNYIKYWEIRSWLHTIMGQVTMRAGVTLNSFKRFVDGGVDHSRVERTIRQNTESSSRPRDSNERMEAYVEMASGLNVKLQFGQDHQAIRDAMPDWFGDIVANLITNTAKMTPNGKAGELTIDYDPAQRTFVFTNSTPPIPEAVYEKIGREMVHGDPEKPGTGEGLLVNINLTRQYGGEMLVDRGHEADPANGVAERGPTFYIRLPSLEGAPSSDIPKLIDLIGADDATFAVTLEKMRGLSEDGALEVAVQLGDMADEIVRRYAERLSAPGVDAEAVRSVRQDFEKAYQRWNAVTEIIEPSLFSMRHRIWNVLQSSAYQTLGDLNACLFSLDELIRLDGFNSESVQKWLERARHTADAVKRPVLENRGYEVTGSQHEMAFSVLAAAGFFKAEKRWDGNDIVFSVLADSKINGSIMDIEAASWSEDVPNDFALKTYLRVLGWTMKVTPADGTFEVRINFGGGNDSTPSEYRAQLERIKTDVLPTISRDETVQAALGRLLAEYLNIRETEAREERPPSGLSDVVEQIITAAVERTKMARQQLHPFGEKLASLVSSLTRHMAKARFDGARLDPLASVHFPGHEAIADASSGDITPDRFMDIVEGALPKDGPRKVVIIGPSMAEVDLVLGKWPRAQVVMIDSKEKKLAGYKDHYRSDPRVSGVVGVVGDGEVPNDIQADLVISSFALPLELAQRLRREGVIAPGGVVVIQCQECLNAPLDRIVDGHRIIEGYTVLADQFGAPLLNTAISDGTYPIGIRVVALKAEAGTGHPRESRDPVGSGDSRATTASAGRRFRGNDKAHGNDKAPRRHGGLPVDPLLARPTPDEGGIWGSLARFRETDRFKRAFGIDGTPPKTGDADDLSMEMIRESEYQSEEDAVRVMLDLKSRYPSSEPMVVKFPDNSQFVLQPSFGFVAIAPDIEALSNGERFVTIEPSEGGVVKKTWRRAGDAASVIAVSEDDVIFVIEGRYHGVEGRIYAIFPVDRQQLINVLEKDEKGSDLEDDPHKEASPTEDAFVVRPMVDPQRGEVVALDVTISRSSLPEKFVPKRKGAVEDELRFTVPVEAIRTPLAAVPVPRVSAPQTAPQAPSRPSFLRLVRPPAAEDDPAKIGSPIAPEEVAGFLGILEKDDRSELREDIRSVVFLPDGRAAAYDSDITRFAGRVLLADGEEADVLTVNDGQAARQRIKRYNRHVASFAPQDESGGGLYITMPFYKDNDQAMYIATSVIPARNLLDAADKTEAATLKDMNGREDVGILKRKNASAPIKGAILPSALGAGSGFGDSLDFVIPHQAITELVPPDKYSDDHLKMRLERLPDWRGSFADREDADSAIGGNVRLFPVILDRLKGALVFESKEGTEASIIDALFDHETIGTRDGTITKINENVALVEDNKLGQSVIVIYRGSDGSLEHFTVAGDALAELAKSGRNASFKVWDEGHGGSKATIKWKGKSFIVRVSLNRFIYIPTDIITARPPTRGTPELGVMEGEKGVVPSAPLQRGKNDDLPEGVSERVNRNVGISGDPEDRRLVIFWKVGGKFKKVSISIEELRQELDVNDSEVQFEDDFGNVVVKMVPVKEKGRLKTVMVQLLVPELRADFPGDVITGGALKSIKGGRQDM